MENVCLDFAGGLLSFAQDAVKSIFLGEDFFKPGAFNIVKFILSLTSIFFNTVFFVQYFSYKSNPEPNDDHYELINEKKITSSDIQTTNSDHIKR